MQTITRVLFENPWPIYVALGVIELVLLTYWRRVRTARAAKRLIGPPVAVVLILVVAMLVVTSRERLIQAVEHLGRDAAVLDVDAAEEHFHQDFELVSSARTIGRDRAIAACRLAIEEHRISSVEFVDFDVKMDGETGQVVLITQIWSGGAPDSNKPMIKWTLYWQDGPAGWKILRVDSPRGGLYIRL